ncbi:hypothetical protein SAMN05877842_1321 [Ureibacillus acetophenoni]|uniref:Uncharacterized protein n=1 Tax=Ureibacillus acetophenoni TaxID=614649 RepID=A0A285UT25_9BACL|nr:hypothetical protein SAMN05877842_1321 [Ureibacillus acetophenoni]
MSYFLYLIDYIEIKINLILFLTVETLPLFGALYKDSLVQFEI